MPSIRYVGANATAFTFQDHRGVEQKLTFSSIPLPGTDIPANENYINGTWIPAHADLSAYQMRCHIFSMTPAVNAIFIVADIGVVIPANWWGPLNCTATEALSLSETVSHA